MEFELKRAPFIAATLRLLVAKCSRLSEKSSECNTGDKVRNITKTGQDMLEDSHGRRQDFSKVPFILIVLLVFQIISICSSKD